VLYVIDEDVCSSYGGDEYVHDSEGLEAALKHEGEDALDRVASRAVLASSTGDSGRRTVKERGEDQARPVTMSATS